MGKEKHRIGHLSSGFAILAATAQNQEPFNVTKDIPVPYVQVCYKLQKERGEK
jgi:hypothetical protein